MQVQQASKNSLDAHGVTNFCIFAAFTHIIPNPMNLLPSSEVVENFMLTKLHSLSL
jgi:hypothetical protein